MAYIGGRAAAETARPDRKGRLEHGSQVWGRTDDVCRFAASASGHDSMDALSKIVSERPSLVSVSFSILRGSNVAHESKVNKEHIR